MELLKKKKVNKGNQYWIFIGRPDVEAEAPILWPPDAKSWLIRKDPDAGRGWGQEKGMTEDEMARWHHWLDANEFGWTPGVGDGQGGLVIHGMAKSQTRLSNWTELKWTEWWCKDRSLHICVMSDVCNSSYISRSH